MTAKTLRLVPITFAAIISAGAAASAQSNPFVGDRLVFVADTLLYKDATGSNVSPLPEFDVTLDKRAGCKDADIDSDNGWICKYDKDVKAGKHAVAVKIVYGNGSKDRRKIKTFQVKGTVVLRDEDKKAEYPDKPSSGEQFWCVLVSKKSISLIPKSEERCHTD